MSQSVAINQGSDSVSQYVIVRDGSYNLDAERDLLGMILQDNNRIEDVDFVLPEYFFNPMHGEIFKTIKILIERKLCADVINVSSALSADDGFKNIGGRDYLLSVYQAISFSTARSRAELIYALWLKRKLISVGKEIVETGEKVDFLEVKNALSESESKIYSLSFQNERSGMVSFDRLTNLVKNNFNLARSEDRPITGIASGFEDLDRMISGFKNSDLIILAARPSMGKTALAVNIAYNVAWNALGNKEDNQDKGGVALFSLEMSADQIATRIISIHTDKNSRVFSTGRNPVKSGDKDTYEKVSDKEFQEICDSMDELKDLPVYIDDSAAITISAIYSRARRLKRKYNISMILIDYLQLIRGNSASSSTNRVQEVSEVTQGLKAIAKELNIPVIALSQLSRAVESRDDKKPQLSDLRESGAIEQDADIVMFLYREAYYMERAEPDRPDHSPPVRESNEDQESYQKRHEKWAAQKIKHNDWYARYVDIVNLAELIVAKNRNGPIGNVGLAFEASKTKFSNRAKFHEVVDIESLPSVQELRRMIPNIPVSDNSAPF